MVLPKDLTSRPQWITWRLESGNKLPNCRWTDSSQQLPFEDVQDFERIGFVFTGSDGLCGIDIDDCIDENGKYNEIAVEIIAKMAGVSYAEISPSGTGIKFWTRARKPEWARCANHNVGVECYDKNRWFAVTGEQIKSFDKIGDGQEAVDWICEKHLKADAKKTVDYVALSLQTRNSDLKKRAEQYVEHCERPAEGGRNNAAFRLAGHLIALLGDDGQRLAISDVLELVAKWNDSLPSPLPDDEIVQVVGSASKSGTPRQDKQNTVQVYSDVNISGIVNQKWGSAAQEQADEDNDNDEDFCSAMVPPSGLIRQVFDFYIETAFRPSHVMGLAVAMSICETIFGRRIRSHTDMRTNDYNLILATTGSGKEACETTITKILDAADPSGSHQLPPDVQSGNGLMKALSLNPCGVWVCDEFGKILQAVLDKKGNQHIKNIGTHLLKLYSKSAGNYGGAAHSDGVRNKVNQPHLVLLGLAAGATVFDSISMEQVADGLFGRIAFWPVQERPPRKKDAKISTPSQEMVDQVASWIKFAPGGNLGSQYPVPEVMKMSVDALDRWNNHGLEIDDRMSRESESRAAVWARVAARSMKLSLVHRAARLEVSPTECQWDFVAIELQDINWGIKLANWLARIACGLIRENTIDKNLERAKTILTRATEAGRVSKRDLLRTFRNITSGDFEAAATELGLTIVRDKTSGRPKVYYERPMI
jgi:hypothetical protein